MDTEQEERCKRIAAKQRQQDWGFWMFVFGTIGCGAMFFWAVPWEASACVVFAALGATGYLVADQ
jgi:hypothetical protein